MKREIKFRAWVYWKNLMKPVDKMRFNKYGCFGYIKRYGSVESEYLMQFTGLKDKNGKEIYEGDIVSIYDPYTKIQLITSIIWDDPNCRFAMMYTFMDFDFLICDEIEVIGNIYKNPELLNQ